MSKTRGKSPKAIEDTGMRRLGNTVFIAAGWNYFPTKGETTRKVVHTTFNTFKLRSATPAELFAEMVGGPDGSDGTK